MAVLIDAVADRLQQFQQLFLQKPDYSGIGYGFSIPGHVVIALFMLLGERIDLVPDDTIPIEIVQEEKPAQPARQDQPAATPAASGGPTNPSASVLDDVERRAKAPLAVVSVNGVDRPKQPGNDGSDPRSNPAGFPVPKGEGELAPGEVPAPSQVMVVAPSA
jgi:hypothetical protein